VPLLDPVAPLAAYYAQLRGHPPDPVPVGWIVQRDGAVLRHYTEHGGFIGYRSVADLAPDDLDALIARQRDIFAARGEPVEWKWHSHDLPSDLPDRLLAAGFLPDDRETVVVGLAEPLTVDPATGWVRYAKGTEFASLWGGSTLPSWRRRGIYRALVAARARLAVASGSGSREAVTLGAGRAR